MLTLPVLEFVTFCDELNEFVVPDLTMLVRRTNACIGQSPGDGPRLLAVDLAQRIYVDAGIDAVNERVDDPVIARRAGLAPQESGRFRRAVEAVFQ